MDHINNKIVRKKPVKKIKKEVVVQDFKEEKSKRENNYPLNKPIIKEVPKNTFYNWLESQNKLGGQHKILRINENKDKINEILEMENSN